MKTKTTGFIFNWFNSLALAITIVILAAITTAKAQNYFDMINGLFTPTQADRFFQAGRKNFEKEVERFYYPERYSGDDLLQIDPELIEQMDQPQQLPDFGADNFQYDQYELWIDATNQ